MCKTCLTVHTGTCKDTFLCKRHACPNAKNQHSILLWPMIINQLVKPSCIKLIEVIPLPVGIRSISRCDLKAIALPTAVITAHSSGVLTLSLENRNVAVLADTGAQHTLISREAAERLKLDIVGKERACLQDSNSLFDVVSVKLGSVQETQPIIFDAFIVPKQKLPPVGFDLISIE